MITDEKLAEWKALAEKVTNYTGIELDEIDVLVDEFEQSGKFKNHSGTLKILRELKGAVTLRTAVPQLLDEVARLRDTAIIVTLREVRAERDALRAKLGKAKRGLSQLIERLDAALCNGKYLEDARAALAEIDGDGGEE